MSTPTQLNQTFTHTTTTHTHTLRYTSLGPPVSPTTPPLIFVHGTPWSHKYWTPFAHSLSSRFHVYLFDRPGFGVSPGPTPLPDTTPEERDDLDASLRGQAEVFAALCRHWHSTENWGDVKPHVIAHDNGGLLTLRATLQHNCTYASLCLIDVVAFSSAHPPFFTLVNENIDVFNAISEEMFEGFMESYIRGAAHKPLNAGTMDMLKQPYLKSKGGIQGTGAFVREMQQADQRDAEDVVGRYRELKETMKGRIKVIWGRDDTWLPLEKGEKLAEMLGAELSVIDEAGHLVHFDQPGALGVELGLCLGRVGSSGYGVHR